MTPTPSPDTVKPTEADKAVALALVMFDHTKEQAAVLIRQHVAAEVARETAEITTILARMHSADKRAGCGFYNDDTWLRHYEATRAWLVGLLSTAHKSSPPPPAS